MGNGFKVGRICGFIETDKIYGHMAVTGKEGIGSARRNARGLFKRIAIDACADGWNGDTGNTVLHDQSKNAVIAAPQ